MLRILWTCALVLLMAGQALAGPLTIAAGAGYKKLVTDLAAAYEKSSGTKPELIFGNMGQVTTQAKAGGVIDVIIGEKGFLEKSGLKFSGEAEIGHGILCMAWPKGKTFTDPKEIAKPDVKRVAMPDAKKAIYGRAATQFLAKAGLEKAVKDKLLVVATVPQVTTYVVSGEVDAGFVNRTDIMNVGDKIGGYLEVDPSLYAPIVIVAESLAGSPNPDGAKSFSAFLATDAAKAIAKKHGM
ncbi:molybdenum ABC transporter, periplasmic molybdate-binding protein [Solidesulfovibrio fructosivorans JJ]]|uniref:Molybdenum ABC transporter, periplasmic molybdate-binding protein n=1 Tax=Solidesulfovibrio fructosivorans JJ] TaxID=596151 RepID=E1JYV8_SOLFR|nr:molybdate ABC transporter substrate-binding protein [Solidesulfovibrio fructosivorans]EFL50528.1 molybdenum ABC transporter, periplasmic molybdate-binding protein [Solidesulfovibrio fructosivorans JJ]]